MFSNQLKINVLKIGSEVEPVRRAGHGLTNSTTAKPDNK